MNIDYVTLWCDDSDPVWHKKRIETMKAHGLSTENLESNQNEATCEGRYKNNNELLYSIRSIKKHAPWIRKIFIVTDNQVPDFLDLNDSQIVMINHTDLFPEEYLPLFNSSVIEMGLMNIPNLSEYFLLGNDDMFLTGDVTPEDFFTPDGKVIFRGRPFKQKIPLLENLEEVKEKMNSNYQITGLSAKTICKHFTGVEFKFLSHHGIDAYRKSFCVEALMAYYQWNPSFKPHTFRHNDDFHRIFFSCYDYARDRLFLKIQSNYLEKHIKKGRFFIAYLLNCCRKPTLESLNLTLCDKHLSIENIKKSQARFLCINDSLRTKDSEREKLNQFLDELFPH